LDGEWVREMGTDWDTVGWVMSREI
jgi:hypothetical protein